MNISKYDIFFIDLSPSVGPEQKGERPCIVLQNNIANRYSNTILVAAMTTVIKNYPHCIIVEPSALNGLNKISRIDLLQMRTVDKKRIIKKIGELDAKYKIEIKDKMITAFDFYDLL